MVPLVRCAVTVKPSETWTCTFNNTTNTGTIKVIKKVDGVQVAGWTVNATNPAGPATITPGSVVTNDRRRPRTSR